MNKILMLVALAIVLAVGAWALLSSKGEDKMMPDKKMMEPAAMEKKTDAMMPKEESVMKKDDAMAPTTDSGMKKEGDAMMPKEESMMKDASGMMKTDAMMAK